MDARTVLTFDDLARKKRKDVSLEACREYCRNHRRKLRRAHPEKPMPSEKDLLHRALVEAQSPLFTVSPAVESGETTQFSSRGLTDWYVREYLRLNHLK